MSAKKKLAAADYCGASTGEMMKWIGDMYAMGPRRAGTDEDHRCEDYLAAALRDFGFDNVHKDPIPMRVWRAAEAKLQIDAADGKSFRDVEAHYIPYTKFTPDDGVEGRLLYVNRMDALTRPFDDWRGRVVVADIRFPKLDVAELQRFCMGMYDPGGMMKEVSRHAVWVRMHWSLYREAARRGAAGFIGILVDHYAGGHRYYAPYGFKEKDIHDKPVPGFWVDRVNGAEIRDLAKKGGARARLLLTGSIESVSRTTSSVKSPANPTRPSSSPVTTTRRSAPPSRTHPVALSRWRSPGISRGPAS